MRVQDGMPPGEDTENVQNAQAEPGGTGQPSPGQPESAPNASSAISADDLEEAVPYDEAPPLSASYLMEADKRKWILRAQSKLEINNSINSKSSVAELCTHAGFLRPLKNGDFVRNYTWREDAPVCELYSIQPYSERTELTRNFTIGPIHNLTTMVHPILNEICVVFRAQAVCKRIFNTNNDYSWYIASAGDIPWCQLVETRSRQQRRTLDEVVAEDAIQSPSQFKFLAPSPKAFPRRPPG